MTLVKRFNDNDVLIKIGSKKVLVNKNTLTLKEFKQKILPIIRLRLPRIDKGLSNETKTIIKNKYKRLSRLFKLISSYATSVLLYAVINKYLTRYNNSKNVYSFIPINLKTIKIFIIDYNSQKSKFSFKLSSTYFRCYCVEKYFPVEVNKRITLNQYTELLEKNFKVDTSCLSDKELLEMIDRVKFVKRLPNSIVM